MRLNLINLISKITGKYFTSIFTDKLIYTELNKDFHELTEHTLCYRMIQKLEHNRYDFI